MKSKQPRSGILLPPPASTILLYAADGLSAWRKNFSPAGFPRTPSRSDWVPMFRQLVESKEGMETLQNLAIAGMEAWKCPQSHIQCLNAAFRDITFRALSIAALHRFADTTLEKIVFPEPVKKQPYPVEEKFTPKPERPQQGRPGTGPHRPPSRRNSPGPSLG